MSALFALLAGAACAGVATPKCASRPLWAAAWDPAAAALFAVAGALFGLAGDGAGSAAGAVLAVAYLILARHWWNRRRRKRKSLRQLGHKARARLAAMARNMPRPGPVLRPVPQGAR